MAQFRKPARFPPPQGITFRMADFKVPVASGAFATGVLMQRLKMVQDEAIVAERARHGDAEAFADLIRAFQGRIRAFFAARLRDASMVDDLAQEAFLIAYRKLPDCDTTRPLLPWLKKIAEYVLLNAGRKHRPQPIDPQDLDATLDRLAVRQAESLEDEEGDADLLDGLRECLGRVQSFSQRLVEARYQEGLSLKAIAEREGKNPTALSVALVRIRLKLRECVQNRHSVEGFRA